MLGALPRLHKYSTGEWYLLQAKTGPEVHIAEPLFRLKSRQNLCFLTFYEISAEFLSTEMPFFQKKRICGVYPRFAPIWAILDQFCPGKPPEGPILEISKNLVF